MTRNVKQRALFAAGIAGAILTSGCSTLRGRSQEVAIETPGALGAKCQLSGDHIDASVEAPGRVNVPKSSHDLIVTCVAPDGASASRTFASSYSKYSYVELPVGYLVDAASGAMWIYPKTLTIPFNNLETQND